MTDGLVRDTWQDPWLVQQGYQRHLLQVAYGDLLLGRLLDRLKATGSYDQSLVAVVADHGASFVAGGNRRTVTRENIADIARVPLLIKYPGQRVGRRDARAARTIDILPPIAGVLGVRIPWAVDGRSLLEPAADLTPVVVSRQDGAPLRASRREVERGMASTLRRKSSLFGEGEDSLYELGSNKKLLGLPVAQMWTKASSTARVHFDGQEQLADVRMSSLFVPTRITGYIEGTEIRPDVELAVAVNGRIAVLTRCFRLDGQQRFSALAPESFFRDGLNRVELLAIDGTPAAPHLIRLGESSAEPE
ncbi:MAG: sulfatase-like hydrolase/transferase [Gaiellaceae bacterium]